MFGLFDRRWQHRFRMSRSVILIQLSWVTFYALLGNVLLGNIFDVENVAVLIPVEAIHVPGDTPKSIDSFQIADQYAERRFDLPNMQNQVLFLFRLAPKPTTTKEILASISIETPPGIQFPYYNTTNQVYCSLFMYHALHVAYPDGIPETSTRTKTDFASLPVREDGFQLCLFDAPQANGNTWIHTDFSGDRHIELGKTYPILLAFGNPIDIPDDVNKWTLEVRTQKPAIPQTSLNGGVANTNHLFSCGSPCETSSWSMTIDGFKLRQFQKVSLRTRHRNFAKLCPSAVECSSNPSSWMLDAELAFLFEPFDKLPKMGRLEIIAPPRYEINQSPNCQLWSRSTIVNATILEESGGGPQYGNTASQQNSALWLPFIKDNIHCKVHTKHNKNDQLIMTYTGPTNTLFDELYEYRIQFKGLFPSGENNLPKQIDNKWWIYGYVDGTTTRANMSTRVDGFTLHDPIDLKVWPEGADVKMGGSDVDIFFSMKFVHNILYGHRVVVSLPLGYSALNFCDEIAPVMLKDSIWMVDPMATPGSISGFDCMPTKGELVLLRSNAYSWQAGHPLQFRVKSKNPRVIDAWNTLDAHWMALVIGTTTSTTTPIPVQDCVGYWGDWMGCLNQIQTREYIITVNNDVGGLNCPYANNTLDYRGCNVYWPDKVLPWCPYLQARGTPPEGHDLDYLRNTPFTIENDYYFFMKVTSSATICKDGLMVYVSEGVVQSNGLKPDVLKDMYVCAHTSSPTTLASHIMSETCAPACVEDAQAQADFLSTYSYTTTCPPAPKCERVRRDCKELAQVIQDVAYLSKADAKTSVELTALNTIESTMANLVTALTTAEDTNIVPYNRFLCAGAFGPPSYPCVGGLQSYIYEIADGKADACPHQEQTSIVGVCGDPCIGGFSDYTECLPIDLCFFAVGYPTDIAFPKIHTTAQWSAELAPAEYRDVLTTNATVYDFLPMYSEDSRPEVGYNLGACPTSPSAAHILIENGQTGLLDGQIIKGKKTRYYRVKTEASGGGKDCPFAKNQGDFMDCWFVFDTNNLTETTSVTTTTTPQCDCDQASCLGATKPVCSADFTTSKNHCFAAQAMQMASTYPVNRYMGGSKWWAGGACEKGLNAILASGSQISWTVIPQFQDPVVRLTGEKRGAGVKTRLEFEFVSLTKANSIYLISTPQLPLHEISFAEVEVINPVTGQKHVQVRNPYSYDPALVHPYDPLVVGVIALDAITITGNYSRTFLRLIDLVFPPGVMRFQYHMRSYYDSILADEIYFSGFDLPGGVHFYEFYMRGLWYQNPSGSLKSQYHLPRGSELARMQLTFDLENPGSKFLELKSANGIDISPVDVCLTHLDSGKFVPLSRVFIYRAIGGDGELSSDILHIELGEKTVPKTDPTLGHPGLAIENTKRYQQYLENFEDGVTRALNGETVVANVMVAGSVNVDPTDEAQLLSTQKNPNGAVSSTQTMTATVSAGAGPVGGATSDSTWATSIGGTSSGVSSGAGSVVGKSPYPTQVPAVVPLEDVTPQMLDTIYTGVGAVMTGTAMVSRKRENGKQDVEWDLRKTRDFPVVHGPADPNFREIYIPNEWCEVHRRRDPSIGRTTEFTRFTNVQNVDPTTGQVIGAPASSAESTIERRNLFGNPFLVRNGVGNAESNMERNGWDEVMSPKELLERGKAIRAERQSDAKRQIAMNIERDAGVSNRAVNVDGKIVGHTEVADRALKIPGTDGVQRASTRRGLVREIMKRRNSKQGLRSFDQAHLLRMTNSISAETHGITETHGIATEIQNHVVENHASADLTSKLESSFHKGRELRRLPPNFPLPDPKFRRSIGQFYSARVFQEATTIYPTHLLPSDYGILASTVGPSVSTTTSTTTSFDSFMGEKIYDLSGFNEVAAEAIARTLFCDNPNYHLFGASHYQYYDPQLLVARCKKRANYNAQKHRVKVLLTVPGNGTHRNEYNYLQDHYCGGRTVFPLNFNIKYGWKPMDISGPLVCQEKCTAEPHCTAFVYSKEKKECYWKRITSPYKPERLKDWDCYAQVGVTFTFEIQANVTETELTAPELFAALQEKLLNPRQDLRHDPDFEFFSQDMEFRLIPDDGSIVPLEDSVLALLPSMTTLDLSVSVTTTTTTTSTTFTLSVLEADVATMSPAEMYPNMSHPWWLYTGDYLDFRQDVYCESLVNVYDGNNYSFFSNLEPFENVPNVTYPGRPFERLEYGQTFSYDRGHSEFLIGHKYKLDVFVRMPETLDGTAETTWGVDTWTAPDFSPTDLNNLPLGKLPKNTNDFLAKGPGQLAYLESSHAQVLHKAPSSLLTVQLTLDTAPAGRKFIIYASENFTWADTQEFLPATYKRMGMARMSWSYIRENQAILESDADLFHPEDVDALQLRNMNFTKRDSLEITCPKVTWKEADAEVFQSSSLCVYSTPWSIVVQMISPRNVSSITKFFYESYDDAATSTAIPSADPVAADTLLGWGEINGFALTSMEAKIYYPKMSLIRESTVGVFVKMRVQVPRNTKLRVKAPGHLEMSCYNLDSFGTKIQSCSPGDNWNDFYVVLNAMASGSSINLGAVVLLNPKYFHFDRGLFDVFLESPQGSNVDVIHDFEDVDGVDNIIDGLYIEKPFPPAFRQPHSIRSAENRIMLYIRFVEDTPKSNPVATITVDIPRFVLEAKLEQKVKYYDGAKNLIKVNYTSMIIFSLDGARSGGIEGPLEFIPGDPNFITTLAPSAGGGDVADGVAGGSGEGGGSDGGASGSTSSKAPDYSGYAMALEQVVNPFAETEPPRTLEDQIKELTNGNYTKMIEVEKDDNQFQSDPSIWYQDQEIKVEQTYPNNTSTMRRITYVINAPITRGYYGLNFAVQRNYHEALAEQIDSGEDRGIYVKVNLQNGMSVTLVYGGSLELKLKDMDTEFTRMIDPQAVTGSARNTRYGSPSRFYILISLCVTLFLWAT